METFYITGLVIAILLWGIKTVHAEEDADKNTADSLCRQGVEYFKIEDYVKARECFELALDIQLKELRKEHPDIVTSLNNLGLAYSALGGYAKAKEYHERALAIREKVLGKEHPDTATSLNNLGRTYSNLKAMSTT
jgi:tetratricopeptide (TPR) repeat protein